MSARSAAVRQAVRRAPMTTAVTALTALVGAAQFLFPAVLEELQRDPAGLRAGQWWRLFTPLLVQGAGWGQYAFNLLGSLLVGVALEARYGARRWLAFYLAAGIAGIVTAYLWQPDSTGSGSSDAVAGLIGALTALLWSGRPLPWWPGYLYGTFFASYLTGLAAAGLIAAVLAGNATTVLVMAVRRAARPRLVRALVSTVVAAGAVAMSALHDGHGVGLLTGLMLGFLLRPAQAGQAAAADPCDSSVCSPARSR